MKTRVAISDLIRDNESYYSLVIGVAKRARDIAQEAEEEHQVLSEKPVQIAVEEFSEGRYHIIDPQ